MIVHHLGLGDHGMSRSMAHGGGRDSSDQGRANLAAPVDPVSHQRLPADPAVPTVYHGRAYYFESRENRETFESDPDKYLAGSPALGQVLGANPTPAGKQRRRGGCC
jgi:YHS domain-containing protein